MQNQIACFKLTPNVPMHAIYWSDLHIGWNQIHAETAFPVGRPIARPDPSRPQLSSSCADTIMSMMPNTWVQRYTGKVYECSINAALIKQ